MLNWHEIRDAGGAQYALRLAEAEHDRLAQRVDRARQGSRTPALRAWLAGVMIAGARWLDGRSRAAARSEPAGKEAYEYTSAELPSRF
jgi:hypothetical protein